MKALKKSEVEAIAALIDRAIIKQLDIQSATVDSRNPQVVEAFRRAELTESVLGAVKAALSGNLVDLRMLGSSFDEPAL